MNNMDKITFLLLQLSCLLFFVGIITTVPVTNVVDGELENLFEGARESEDVAPKLSEKVRQVATYPLYPPYSFSPFGFYPWLKPGKIPFMLPPMLPVMNADVGAPADTKKTNKRQEPEEETTPPPPASPFAGTGKFFKDKKTEFLSALFEQISATTEPTAKRAVAPTADPAASPVLPKIDPSFFISKKYDFLSKLFLKLNSTTTTAAPSSVPGDTDDIASTTTTPKPTIVPPDFWVPFPFLVKPSKAPKPPKPSKPPKVSSSTLLSKLTLADILENPSLLDQVKRSIPVPPSKAGKPGVVTIPLDYYIPANLDPTAFSDKFQAFLDKFFKKLNKTVDSTSPDAITPKATVVPAQFWNPTPPEPAIYTSTVDAFLDLLFKSLDKPTKKVKREVEDDEKLPFDKRSFFDDLFNYHPSTTPESVGVGEVEVGSQEGKPPCSMLPKPDSSKRSLGFGMVMPPYIYAAKLAMYQDALNTAAAINAALANEDISKRSAITGKEQVLTEITNFLKCLDSVYDQVSIFSNTLKDSNDLSRRNSRQVSDSDTVSKETAQALILADLTFLKNGLIEAYDEALKTQKTLPTSAPASKKTKPVPVWAKFKTPVSTTVDPLTAIQKRIELISSVFDMLTEVEKELVGGSVNITQPSSSTKTLLETTPPPTSAGKSTIVPPSFWAPDLDASVPPDSSFYLTKTQEFLNKLFESKLTPTDESVDS